MALSYDDSRALMDDMTFRGRVKVACLHFAAYIMDEPQTEPAHNTRMKWAGRAFQMPDTVAQELTPPTVMDAQVQADGAQISDANLQVALETAAKKLL